MPKEPPYVVVARDDIEVEDGRVVVVRVHLPDEDTEHTFSWTPDTQATDEDIEEQLTAWANAMRS